jgi:hypothetical protein
MMSKFYHSNNGTPVYIYSAFTKSGAYVLAKRYQNLLKAVIIEPPFYDDDKKLWCFIVEPIWND